MSSNWDIESYRKEYECDEHWELREAFMQAYKHQFTEDEVVCLAQVFVNIELLGCRYPTETMEKVAYLSESIDVVKKYRESRRTTLKRTFIQAEDAVAMKYNKSSLESNIVVKPDTDEQPASSSAVPVIPAAASLDDQNLFNLLRDIIIKVNAADLEINNFNSVIQAINAERRRMNAPELLQKVKINHVSTNPSFSVQYLYSNTLLVDASGTGVSATVKNKTKAEASEMLYKLLKKYCYTVKAKVQFLLGDAEISKSSVEAGPGTKKPSNNSNIQQEGFDDKKIEENNIGYKMLKMLGWKAGGALGSKSEGIVDPVSLQIKIDKKAGFGLMATNNDALDYQAVKKLLVDYKNSYSEYDLAFSADFTKEDRATIHEISRKLQLKSRSFGGEATRQIIISSQKDNLTTIKNKLLAGDQLMQQRYELIPPELEFARAAPPQAAPAQQHNNRNFNSNKTNNRNNFKPNQFQKQWQPPMRRQF